MEEGKERERKSKVETRRVHPNMTTNTFQTSTYDAILLLQNMCWKGLHNIMQVGIK